MHEMYFYSSLSSALHGYVGYARALKLVNLIYLVDNYESFKQVKIKLRKSKGTEATLRQCDSEEPMTNLFTIWCTVRVLQIRINPIFLPPNGIKIRTCRDKINAYEAGKISVEGKRKFFIL